MSRRAATQVRPFRFRRSIHLLSSGLCSLLALAACAQKERAFQAGGGGSEATGTGGGSSAAGTGGDGPATGTGGGAAGTGGDGAGATGAGGDGSGAASTGGGGGATGAGGAPCEVDDDDCTCVDGRVVARDVDGDGQGSRLCEAAPGKDCDDGDRTFVQNECGGCNKSLGGRVGAACEACGVYRCLGDSALQCATPDPPPRQCRGNVVQVCAGAQWTTDHTCSGRTQYCFKGQCVECLPGTFKCGEVHGSPVVIRCLDTGSWESSWSVSCSSLQSCNAQTGTCVGQLHPRDLDFDVPPPSPVPPGAPAPGLPTRDVLDLAVGIAFA